MLPGTLWALCLSILEARAATTTSNNFYSSPVATLDNPPKSSFTGTKYTYITSKGQIIVESLASSSFSGSQSATASASLTTLAGNGTASSTRSSASPKNTVPCNGFPEFCERKYSNITQVCAHNSAFAIKGNAASNQELSVTDQLDDGIRMLQGETHWVNDTIMNCHTTCNLLDVGPWQSELEVLVDWLRRNPYDVVTWLVVNSDFVSVEKYVPAIKNSGLLPYMYEPSHIPQRLDQWPLLSDMILTGKRVVMFMDYKANQSSVPYILDEFTHMFETPFSPTNKSFPCTRQRPPGLSDDDARNKYMYVANHNLNTAVDLSALIGGGKDSTILIPNTAEINNTNGEYNQLGQAEAMSLNCTEMWDRPPNFLLVDYYNYGDPRGGSVFEVAAKANGVTYNLNDCCGEQSAAPAIRGASALLLTLIAFTALWFW